MSIKIRRDILQELIGIIWSNKYHRAFLLLFVLSFFIRLYFRSAYLDDWDSIQFVLGLADYSIVVGQPHPPGYILYIFIGRIFKFFIDDEIVTFTFISALFGSLSLIPTFLISKEIFNDRVGLLSAVMLALTPSHMLFSEVVMTDIVSLFFITFTTYVLYLGINSTKCLYFASIILGITAGIRMTDLILVLPLLLILIYKKDIGSFFISSLLILTGIGIWLIPLILDTGFNALLSVLHAQWSGNSVTTTLYSFGDINLINVLLTLSVLVYLLIKGWSPALPIFISAVLCMIFINLKQTGWVKHLNYYILDIGPIFVLTWLFTFLVFSLFSHCLYITRYLLPLFPPMAIIFSFAIIRLIDIQNSKDIKILLYILLLMSLTFMGSQAITAAYAIHTTTPAPVKAANFIQEHYKPDDTIIVAYESFRHFQYYLPQYGVKFSETWLVPFGMWSTKEVLEMNAKTVVSDFPITFYESEKDIVYESKRDHNIYPKHSNVKLYDNNMNRVLLPFIIVNWHSIENWNGIQTRWMSNDACLLVYSDKNCTANFSFEATSFLHPRTLELYLNGRYLASMNIPIEGFVSANVRFDFNDGKNVILFHVPEGCERPCDIPELNNIDRRWLSIAVQNVTITYQDV